MAILDDRNNQKIIQAFEEGGNLSDKDFSKALREALNYEDTTYQSLLNLRKKLKKAEREYANLTKRAAENISLLEELEEKLKTASTAERVDLRKQIEEQERRQKVILEEGAKRLELKRNLEDSIKEATETVKEQFKNAAKFGIDLTEKDLEAMLATDEIIDRLDDNIEALKMKKKKLYTDLDELKVNLEEATENDDTEKVAEIKEAISKIYEDLRENLYEINALENDKDEINGKAGKRATNRLEDMFGKDIGSSLNFLGSRENLLGKGIGNILDTISGQGEGVISDLSNLIFNASKAAEEKGEEYDSTDALLDAAEFGAELIAPEFVPVVEGLKASKAILTAIFNDIRALNAKMGEYINTAAQEIKSYYGAINANLYGYSDYDTLAKEADILGGSTLVRQTDYLSQIAALSADGVARDIEAAAILQTIKDRTLTQFDVSNDSLRRLIRLGQDQVYQSQFGLELQLKKVLNSTFKDSGYLSSLFDSVRDAIMDASVNQSGDITTFNSIVQTWLGAMYSSGLSSNVVNQIASGINALGSGNVSALASDEATQRLFLLAMDRVGMDYADILQQGLSSSDTNKLLQSVVQYLGEITVNTSDNLVLKSSYANLFNLSTTDLKAIQNLNQSMPSITSMIVDTSNALTMTQYAASDMLKANTSVSEKWDNFFANLQYAVGSNVAESNFLYSTWATSSLIEDLTTPILQNKLLNKLPTIAVPAKAANIVATLSKFGISVESMLSAIPEAAGTIFEGQGDSIVSLLNLNNANSANISSTLSPYSRTTLKNSSMFNKMSASVSTVEQAASEYKEDTDTGKILEEIEKALRKQKEHYAFAVYLEGMTDETLKSFASIFADEDAMLQTFKGNNSVIEDNLFTYIDDNSSNKNDSTQSKNKNA